MSAPTTAARILLEGLVDYAGLFPPAELDMASAVRQYAGHLAEEAAWMLGRFIVPAARLDEFETASAAHLPRTTDRAPWRLSVLAGADPADAAGRVQAFNERHGHGPAGRASIDTMELRAADAAAVGKAARSVPPQVIPYIEIPIVDDPAALIAAIGGAGARAKIRTGGVTAEAFPPPAQVARFIRLCADAGVPFKATAGLHHPLRGEYRLTYEPAAPSGPMYGFLNVFLAAAFAAANLGLAQLETVLVESAVGAFQFDETGVSWRKHRLDLDDLRHLRTRAAVAFGSCSFADPVADLRTIHLL